MKTNLIRSKTAFLILILMVSTGLVTKAATYTATTSGNWSSSVTWGGTAPGFNVTSADAVVIPLGVAVTLDNDLTVNNASATLAVAGTLTGTFNLALTAGTLSGTGAVTLNSLVVGTGGLITTTGAISVGQFANSQATLALGTVVNVSNTLALNAGVVQLNTGSVINLANNATINMAGGSYSVVAGLLSLAGNYNVLYSGSATLVGLETTLLGLQNVTVNLPTSASQLSLAANLSVAGTLTLTQGILSLNGNSLTINGGINSTGTGSILGNATSNIIVNGTGSVGTIAFANAGQTINNLTINIGAGGSISLASNVIVGGALSLTGSSLNLNGYNLTIAGTVSELTTGSIVGNSTSNVTVTGTGLVGTLTFSSTGNTLGSMTINIAAAGSVLLGSNVTVSGTLALTSGSLDLNGQSITVGGAISPTGTGSITGNIASNITFNGIGNAGTLVFSAASQTINNLTINIGSSGSVALGSNATVGGTLTLAQGNINVGVYDLTIPVTGSLTGGSSASYVVTSDTGSLIMTVANAGGSATYVVGTLANFAPVTVTNNSAALTGVFSVVAMPAVFAQGTIGTNLALTQPVVNTSWDVSSSLATGVNVDLQMQWSTAMQVNAFDNTQAYISHFTSGAWNTSALTTATAHAGGTYSLALTGVTSFSPFAVFDKNTATAIHDVKSDLAFSIYPNPANKFLQIMVPSTGNLETVKVFDMLGNQLLSQPVENLTTSLDISNFASGVYFVSINNSSTKKFVKE